MWDDEIFEALFHLAQIYEICIRIEPFKSDKLYKAVLLELADKLIDELRNTERRPLEKEI